MDKLSIYELLSYFVPGIFLNKLLQIMLPYWNLQAPFVFDDNIKDNLFLLFAALVVGVMIHRITFWFVEKKYNWYKQFIYEPIAVIVKKNVALQKKADELLKDKHIPGYDELFDSGYYYLETNNKIEQAKNFQSFYFLFRNLITVLLIVAGLSVLSLAISCFSEGMDREAIIKAIALLVALLIPMRWVGNWLREKMVERIINSYYSEIIHQ